MYCLRSPFSSLKNRFAALTGLILPLQLQISHVSIYFSSWCSPRSHSNELCGGTQRDLQLVQLASCERLSRVSVRALKTKPEGINRKQIFSRQRTSQDVPIRTKNHSSRSWIPAPGRDTRHSTQCRPELAWERRRALQSLLQNTTLRQTANILY
jgi:hypothetical protein